MYSLDEFKKRTWKYNMDNSKGLDGWSNYGGGIHDYAEWVSVVSRSRDSEILEESNFESALDELGDESDNVAIVRFGHWACGWIESLMINPKSKEHLLKAYDIYKRLQEYPVLNDDDYSERTYEYASDYANYEKQFLAQALSKHFNILNGKKLIEIAYDLNVECQYYYGMDSCIDIYKFRSPDRRDVDRLLRCLNEIEHNYKSSKVFKKLKASVQAELNKLSDV